MLAAASILALTAAVPPVAAQPAAEQSQARAVDIPAGPLGTSLFAVSETFGVAVLAPRELVAGLSAPAVSGTMDAAEALDQLLRGSDLAASPSPGGGFLIERRAPQVVPARTDATLNADAIVVTATRAGTPLENLPVSVSIINEQELVEQIRQNRNIVTALEFAVPGLSVQAQENRASCRTQLRSRTVAFQINGVPVNQDLRCGSSNGPFSVSPFSVERVEVLRGGTALYGAGAPGGIINFITRRAKGKELEIDLVAQTSFNTENTDDTFTTETYAGLGQDFGQFDYYAGVGYTDGGRQRSASGTPVASRDRETLDVIASAGYRFGDSELRFTGTFQNEDRGDFFAPTRVLIPDTPFNNVIEVPAGPSGDEAGGEDLTATLSFTDEDLLWHSVSLSLFFQESTFRQRDNFFREDLGDIFFASDQENDRIGFRSTLVRSYNVRTADLKTSYGFDFTRNDFSRFALDPNDTDVLTGYIAPALFLETLAAFGQAELNWNRLTLSARVRQEWYNGAVKEDGFDPDLPFVSTPGDFEDSSLTLFNAGAVYDLRDTVQIYAGFSQGAELSQLGRAARGQPDPSIISNEPATSDQYEVGLRGSLGDVRLGIAAYYSESDKSAQLQPDPRCADQGPTAVCPLIPLRIPERLHGFELDVNWEALDTLSLSGVFTLQRGEVQDQETGEFINFDTNRTVPLRVTVRGDWRPIDPLNLGLQVSHYGASSFFTPTQEGIGFIETDDVTLVSASAGYEVGPATIYVAADNLLNESYINPNAEADGPNGFFTYEAPGRRLTFGVRARF